MSHLDGIVVSCGQSAGPEIQLRIFGDEFYARYETLAGYTVVYDLDKGRYCYATLAVGCFVSSGVPANKPAPLGLRKHLTEDMDVRNEKFEARHKTLRPEPDAGDRSATRTFGPDNGLLTGRKLTSGSIRGLTLIVQFADVTTTITKAQVDDLMNADAYSAHGNACSVKEYFQTLSSGKLTYTNHVVGPITLSKGRSHYIDTSMVKEAMDKAVAQFGLRLSDYDSTGAGVVDALNILYAGNSQYSGWLWPHNSVKTLEYDGVETHFYQITGLGSAPVDLAIGTICHENGHMLCRFPDIYDYGRRDNDNKKSQGIGRYCLMGSGNHLDQGRTPAPICAYMRDLVGWVDNMQVLSGSGSFEATHGAYDTAFKWETDVPNEYFLIENRSQLGFDAHLPASGLAVYHCDTLGSNEWQDGTRLRHYQCALLQADGRLDLENNLNAGDPDDLYADVAGVALSDQSVPDSRQWDGTDSLLKLSDIGAAGQKIAFRVGDSQSSTKAEGESFPNSIIPDDDPAGVSDTITIDALGKLVGLQVRVEITHSWISDLEVSLESPSGKKAILHQNAGRDGDDIFATYTMSSLRALDVFKGEAIQGAWKLHIVDEASEDVGRLKHWALEIDYEKGGGLIELSSSPSATIPDRSPTGIEDSLSIAETGELHDITVSVDIEHTFIGDLEVDLISPSGVVARLHDNSGWSADNLKRTYDLQTSTVLNGLVGQQIKGKWSLRVRDLAAADYGTLNKWSLELSY